MARTAKLVRQKKAKKKSTRKSPPAHKGRVAKKATKKTSKKVTKRAPQKTKAKKVAKGAPANQIKVGGLVPEFSLPSTAPSNSKANTEQEFQFSTDAHKGKALVLYFYPKDNTPGCTLEGQDFKKLYDQFASNNCEVVGISRDSLKSHEKFKSKFEFPFALLADENEQLCRLFDVIRPKKLYGREFIGVERSTFVIDENHVLRAEWRNVKVTGHAQEVLEFVKKMRR